MKYESAAEVLEALIQSYYEMRDMTAVLSCVTEDIEWIGTEKDDCARGKGELQKLLKADAEMFPDPFRIVLEKPVEQKIGENACLIALNGKQVADPGKVCGFSIRGSVLAVQTEDGWKVCHVHTSVPNSEIEKYSLKRELDENRKKEKILLSGIPGGVAIYRLKKDGRFITDFVSDGLGRMCGYESGEEFQAYLREDAMINVVKEDVPILIKAAEESVKTHKPISIIYHLHRKNDTDILNRLDANLMDNGYEEDDIAVWYAVHTIVSEETKKILREQKLLRELIDDVPTGIGIYEVQGEQVSQSYMNNAFYEMLDGNRESRKQYFGRNALKAAHPDDVEGIYAAIERLRKGAESADVIYRLKLEEGKWFWVRLQGSVVERKENYFKIYAAFSDYNEIIQAQKELERGRVTLESALQSAKVLTWRFDYKTSTITDSLTLGRNFNLPQVVKNVPQAILDAGFIAEESIDEFHQLFEQLPKEKTVSVETKANVEGDSGFMWFRQIYTPIFDAAGNYVDFIAVAIDITEQKHREQNYEEQLRLNRIAMQDAMSKVNLNLTRNQITSFESVDPEFEKLRGITTADEILASPGKMVHDDEDREKFQQVSDCATMIKNYKNGISHIDIVCHMNESTKWLHVIYDIIENPYNGDIEAVSAIHDITDQKRAELVVNKLLSIDYQSIMIVNAKNGNAIPFRHKRKDENLDEVMKLQEENGTGTAGLDAFLRKYAVPGTAEKAILENSAPYIQEQLKHAPYYECMYALLKEEQVHQYRVVYSYLENEKDVFLCAVQDVSDIYEAEERQKHELATALQEAQSANCAKTAFLSRVSHDMRTPLNGILGLTTLLKENCSDEKMRRDLEELEMSGNYLLNLINDTLDVSRIESGRLELHPVVCEGQTIFNNALGLAKTSIRAKNIRLTMDAENIPFTYFYTDVARLEQVIMNVFGNAVKFTPEGGEIKVRMRNLSVKDGMITDQLEICDNGIGMSPEFLPHVFEPFSQEDGSRTSVYQGTGLGMAITRQLLRLMNSDIEAESTPGKGSCFRITFRFQTATKEQIADWKRDMEHNEENHSLEGKRILLCEDHPLNAKIAIRLLEARNILVEHAENGQRGVEMFEGSAPGYYDAILMDIRMPVMDGIDASKAIRSLPRSDARKIPIIAMTANALASDVEHTKSAGMDAHLSKPIQTELMYKTLGELMQSADPEERGRNRW